ncbi:hypothetical protein [Kitasatospora sp. NPDC056531]|uniref:hypothetical protein n=1 Tax=Kitasatospora sp. NPDC056531 TaxID=3345856 RepID=UPI003683D3DF
MRILLLGPLELRTAEDTTAHIGGARRRAALAALALEANRIVPVERLLDLARDHAPPPTARAALQATSPDCAPPRHRPPGGPGPDPVRPSRATGRRPGAAAPRARPLRRT